MGANGFADYHYGVGNVQKAFDRAVRKAKKEHGSRGYTGTIAEKDDVVILHAEPVTLDEAHRLAGEMWDRNEAGTDDKHGKVGAIAVKGEARRVSGKLVPSTTGYATPEEAATESLRAAKVLRAGESVARVSGVYETNYRGWVVSGDVKVLLEGDTTGQQTGWLFFGTAGC